MSIMKATFAAGCFWGVEHAFRSLPGVTTTTVGYTGGAVDSPSYEQVCTDTTGHAEAVLVEYDADKVTYEDLLEVFWSNHDPTQKNRQGPDVGTQYRSVIHCHDTEQQRIAEQSLLAQQSNHGAPIATLIESASTFGPAEEYHQQYLEKRGMKSCFIG
jgi:peptide-methionine (S)-S-oxide reductase